MPAVSPRTIARIKQTVAASVALAIMFGPAGYGLFTIYSFMDEWRKDDKASAEAAAKSDEVWWAEDKAFREKVLDGLSEGRRERATLIQAVTELEIANIAHQRMLADINYRLGVLEGRRRANEPGRNR